MTNGKYDSPNVSVGGFAVKGRGSRKNARHAGDMVTSALARLTVDSAQRDFPGTGDSVDNVKVQVPHDADAGQIEQALRAALKRKGGRR